ncbi:MAG: hypothetical protein ACR2LJ_04080 [Acidimicrobiales bacterium]
MYRFDAVERVPIDGQVDDATVRVIAGDLGLTLHGGRGWPIPMAGFRGRSLGRRFEAPLARWLLGVRTSGTESRRRRASADAGEDPGHEQIGDQS